MPYLTPDEIPEDDYCRPLSIPYSTAWLAIVSGALTELTKSWNWQQDGTVTVDEAVDRMNAMIADYYADVCSVCEQPDGEPWVGLDELGSWRMLENGDWGEPTGDYAIPPQTARTETTAEERRCLAAKNAVNVLSDLYEEVSDAAESGLTSAEYLIDFALLIGLAIAGPIGLLAKAAIAIAVFAYKEFFNFSDFLTEDFWTSDFTEKMECILFDNSTDSAGVVSFDFEAIYAEIFNTQTFDLTTSQLRLAGQVQYLMRIIGVEGLNLAGETTAITDDNCDFCSPWCCEVDLTGAIPSWLNISGSHWQHDSDGITSVQDGSHQFLDVEFEFGIYKIFEIELDQYQLDLAGTNQAVLKLGATTLATDFLPNTVGASSWFRSVGVEMDGLVVNKHRAFGSTPKTMQLKRLLLRGEGAPIPCGTSNC